MESKIAEQIIELARKWQQESTWSIAYGQAGDFREYRDSAAKDRKGFQLQWAALLKAREPDADLKSNPEGMLELFRHGAERDEELSKMAHKNVIDVHQEFLDLKKLLCAHAPALSNLVPKVDFFNVPPTDFGTWLDRMGAIEAGILSLVAAPSSAVGGAATNGSVEERALAVLVLHPEWSNAKIATEVGTHPKYLSSKDCSRFRAARAAIRDSKIPSGTKSKLGSVEAVGDDDLDFDAMDNRMRNKR